MGALEVEKPRLNDFVFLGISSSLGPVAEPRRNFFSLEPTAEASRRSLLSAGIE